MSLSTVSFFAQLGYDILCLKNIFLRAMILMALSLNLLGTFHLLVFSNQLPSKYALDLCAFLFLITPFLIVVFQLFRGVNPNFLKKWTKYSKICQLCKICRWRRVQKSSSFTVAVVKFPPNLLGNIGNVVLFSSSSWFMTRIKN